ncbi:MAG: hypothetical protein WCK91_01785 [bacterium]
MIKRVIPGDITARSNPRHIIRGINDTLDDLSGIGLENVERLKQSLLHPLILGSTVRFGFEGDRKLFMVVCHKIGKGGWANADNYIRYAMDNLHHSDEVEGLKGQEYSIVQIGAGPVGDRDGADVGSIITAMATSLLPVTLFVNDFSQIRPSVKKASPPHLVAEVAWHPEFGRQELAYAA